jgi:hypothetical protein
LERLDRKLDSEGCNYPGNSQGCAPLVDLKCSSGTGVAAEEPAAAQPVAAGLAGKEGLDSFQGACFLLSGIDYVLCEILYFLDISWNISILGAIGYDQINQLIDICFCLVFVTGCIICSPNYIPLAACMQCIVDQAMIQLFINQMMTPFVLLVRFHVPTITIPAQKNCGSFFPRSCSIVANNFIANMMSQLQTWGNGKPREESLRTRLLPSRPSSSQCSPPVT